MRNISIRKGFTLIELLISLAITAALLSAVAGAMHASLNSYAANEDLADVMQTSRAVLERMARDIRTAQTDHSDPDPNNHVDVEWYSGQNLLCLTPPSADVLEIQYQLVDNQLIYREIRATGTVSSTLIAATDNVQLFSYVITTEQDAIEADITKCVRIQLVLEAGGVTYPMTATASPRQNQFY